MDVGAALVADGRAAEAGQPGQGALDDPAMAAQAIRALDAAARDAGGDGSRPALVPAAAVIVGLVRVELPGSASWPPAAAAHARDDIEHRGKQRARRGGSRRSARSPAACRARRRGGGACVARPAPVGRVRPDRRRAATSAPFCRDGRGSSIDARSQSRASASASRSSRRRCGSPTTPASFQSRSRRQHVMPVQPNTSRGSRSQPIPDHRTNTMPSSARRSQHSRAAALRLRGLGGQQRLHRRPQLVAQKSPAHHPQHRTTSQVLLGAHRPST